MIVVEGPDGAGKTTLITKLSVDLELPVAPRVVSKDTEAMVDLKKWTEENVAKGFHKTIYDRHRLISEPIYGSVLRDDFEPGFGDIDWLESVTYQFYSGCQPIIIYCLPPFKTVLKNVEGDPENAVPGAHIRKIYSLYVAKAASDMAVNPRALLYDYTQDRGGKFYNLMRARVNNAR